MIRINQLKLPAGSSEHELKEQIRRLLRLKDDDFTFRIARKSLDARRKPKLYDIYTVSVQLPQEEKLVARLKHPSVSIEHPLVYRFPAPGEQKLCHRPVIIGAGPAGLFAACQLAEAGYAPIIVERGGRVEERTRSVERFWTDGSLDPDSNVQFGEGGAGTFSDGKLNTAVKDPSGRNAFVLDTFVRFGAQERIRYESKPHIGTDVLKNVIRNMRNDLEARGCSFYFHTKLTQLRIENGRCQCIRCEGPDGPLDFPVEALILAIGHSARDTFRMLEQKGIPMEAKSFAVGFRVEHPQAMIDLAMYGEQKILLPAASYKLTANCPDGRGVYSFCMCPGGYVVNASSADGGTVVNGMSYSGRSGKNANSAIIVSVTPADFGGIGPLAGIAFQERLEQANYRLGQGRIPQQLYGDFVQNVPSSGYGAFSSGTKGACRFANLRGLMSPEMEHAFMQGMSHFAGIIADFDRKDAILSGMETRTSSPVRILRNESGESAVQNIYPCGEGAGYAGGIMSAAIDGLRAASAVMERYQPPN